MDHYIGRIDDQHARVPGAVCRLYLWSCQQDEKLDIVDCRFGIAYFA